VGPRACQNILVKKIGTLDCAAHNLVTIPTMLFRLPWDRYFFYGLRPLVSLGLLIVEVLRSHLDTPQLVELLWTSDCPVAETRVGNIVHIICKYYHKWKELVQ
jgi:hypothetical protein